MKYLFIACNILAFALFGIDKWKAMNHKWRIPEVTLLLVSVFGIVGGICGMRFFHHKTQKPKFCIGLPIILVIEVVYILVKYL